ncbi:MAG: YncE family protein [Longimicrobiales bacterium]
MSHRTPTARATNLLALGLTLLTTTGCWDDSLLGADPTERVSVVEDPVLLDGRIEHMDLRLEIEDPSPLPSAALVTGIPGPSAAPAEPVLMKLIAEVDSPELDGVMLQATHVAMKGKKAYVSYNVQGSTQKGAIDAFDDMNESAPVLTSSVRLHDADVSSVAYESKKVYVATGAVEGSFPTTAVLEVVRLRDGDRRFEPTTDRIELPSFVGTGVTIFKDLVYVTSGDGGPVPGGLSVFDEKTLELVAEDRFPDARAVSADGDWVVALRGSPAELRVYDKDDGNLVRVIPVGGAMTPDSKSGLAIDKDVAVVAVGEAGIRVVDLETGAILGEMPVPDISGLNPADVVANGVAVHKDLIFVALGAGGLWAIRAADKIKDLADLRDPDLQWAGRVGFPDATSVNFVAADKDRLFVAGGNGGLKIIAFDAG